MGGDHLKRGCIIGVSIGPGKPIGAAAKAGCIAAPGGRAPIMPAKQRSGRLVRPAIENRGGQRKQYVAHVRHTRAFDYSSLNETTSCSPNPIIGSFFLSLTLFLIGNQNPQVYLRRDCSRYIKIIMGPVCCVNM